MQDGEPTGAVTSNAVGAASTYSFTFGTYNQTAPWTDVRTLSWTACTELLTRHEFGPKEGTCIVPAIFAGGRRTKHKAQQIDVVFLDSDSGAGLDEISHAIRQRGWAAVISSTHSHQTRRTTGNRSKLVQVSGDSQ